MALMVFSQECREDYMVLSISFRAFSGALQVKVASSRRQVPAGPNEVVRFRAQYDGPSKAKENGNGTGPLP